MLRRYRNEATSDIALGVESKSARRLLSKLELRLQASRRIKFLRSMKSLHDLKGVGFGLHRLSGDRNGQWAIKLSGKYRICFVWDGTDAFDIEIVDYH